MKKITPYIFLVFLAGFCSCKKFLEAKSQNEFTPVTTESYSELLFGTGYPRSILTLQEQMALMDDDVQNYVGSKTPMTEVQLGAPAYCWQPDWYDQLLSMSWDANSTCNAYRNYYSLILGANVAIQNADGSSGTASDKAFLKGEAYALRAYYYFMLVNLYGRPYNDSTTTPDKSPGVPLTLSPDLSQAMPVRNSVAEVYARISKDLDSAMVLLDGEKRFTDLKRMNHVAAHLLASRVNLYLGQWDSVVSNASYVLQYHPDLADLNSWGATDKLIGTGAKESIWSFGSLNEFGLLGTRGLCYDVSTGLASQFGSGDLRSQVYFRAVPPIIQIIANIPTAYQDTKRDFGGYTLQLASSFRSSEAYLNRAEAYAQLYLRKGDNSAMQNALNDLNALRIRRIAPASYQPLGAMTADSLLQFCRNERRRELFHEECHRWFDLRRYGMPAIQHIYYPTTTSTVTYTLQAHDPQYTLPLPPDALHDNANLVQNPLIPERQPQ